MRRWGEALAWMLLAACGADGRDGGAPDGGPGAVDAGTGVADLAPPAPPAPVSLLPCADGWREVPGDEGVATCEPFSGAPVLSCPAGEARWPSTGACVTVGRPCPAGDFAEPPAGAVVRYVRAGASGGDGTRASPFGRIADAIDAAEPGTVVMLSRGSFDEEVVLPAGVTLQGACAAETALRASPPSDSRAVVTAFSGGAAALRDLRIAGGARPGVGAAGAGTTLELDGVVVENAELVGLLVVEGARVTGGDVVVRGTRARGGTFGYGVNVDGGSVVDLARVALERNHDVGAIVTGGGSRLRLVDATVRETAPEVATGAGGRGVTAQLGGLLELDAVVVEGGHDAGVFVIGGGTIAQLEDLVVRGVAARQNDRKGGQGLFVQDGAEATCARCRFEDDEEAAVAILSATATLEDVVVRATRPGELATSPGAGLLVADRAQATVRRGLFARNRVVAVAGSDPETTLRLEDVVIVDTLPDVRDGLVGNGLEANGGARVEVLRGRIERHHNAGVVAASPGTVLVLEDVAVRDTRGQEADGTRGRGLSLQDGSAVEVRRALFERNREVAIFAAMEGSTLTLEDVVVRDTESETSSGQGGRALSIQQSANATVRRARFERSRGVGVLVAASAVLTAEDLHVLDVARPACAEGPCSDEPAAMALAVSTGARATLRGFTLGRGDLCGALLGPEGELDLSEGEIRENAVGACVQREGYDLARITASVTYVDNGINVDATELTVPSPAPTLPL